MAHLALWLTRHLSKYFLIVFKIYRARRFEILLIFEQSTEFSSSAEKPENATVIVFFVNFRNQEILQLVWDIKLLAHV